MTTGGTPVTGPRARFEWERALRTDRTVPRHLKGFLFLIGTYMNNDGTLARPRVTTLADEFGLSRQRAFELIQEAEIAGWLVSQKRAGKTSERRPALPLQASTLVDDPSDPPEGYPSDGSDGSDVDKADPSDGSDASRQTGLTGRADPSDRSDPTELLTALRTTTAGGTLPPDPLRPSPPQAPGSTDQPQADQPGPPVTNSSPKPNHRSARAKRRSGPRRGRPRGTSPPLLAIVHDELPPTGTDSQP